MYSNEWCTLCTSVEARQARSMNHSRANNKYFARNIRNRLSWNWINAKKIGLKQVLSIGQRQRPAGRAGARAVRRLLDGSRHNARCRSQYSLSSFCPNWSETILTKTVAQCMQVLIDEWQSGALEKMENSFFHSCCENIGYKVSE